MEHFFFQSIHQSNLHPVDSFSSRTTSTHLEAKGAFAAVQTLKKDGFIYWKGATKFSGRTFQEEIPYSPHSTAPPLFL